MTVSTHTTLELELVMLPMVPNAFGGLVRWTPVWKVRESGRLKEDLLAITREVARKPND